MRQDNDYRRGRTCVFALRVHLVFVTKYRRKVLDREALTQLHAICASVAADFGALLHESNGEDDHLRLLVEYPAAVSVSALVNSLKGVSSRLLRRARPDLSHRYYRGALWSPSYFAASGAGVPLSDIRQYIEQQRKPVT
jgi:putative transposase